MLYIFIFIVCKDVATAINSKTVMSVRLNATSIGNDFKENCSFNEDVQAMFYINKQHQMIPIFSKKVNIFQNGGIINVCLLKLLYISPIL